MKPAVVVSTLLVGLAGCGSSDAGTTTGSKPPPRLERLAYEEVQALSRRTCAAVPRETLWRSLSSVSDDPATASGPRDDNGIALLYAEDVTIQDIPLQRAAYDGCLAGLESQP